MSRSKICVCRLRRW